MALDIHVPSLGDAEQGKDYDYKSRCEELESALNETRSALDEFQLSSRELEAELEKELENMERQYKDAKRQKERLKMESDDWKVQPPPTHPLFEKGAEFVVQVSTSKDGADAEYECYAEGD